MKPQLLVMAAVLLAAGPADAISRYTSTRMSCDRVKATIYAEGAVIMRWQSRRTPGLPLYGRYVADGRFCELGEYAAWEFIPAADTAECPVYECKQYDLNDDDEILRFRH
ncbi:MAG: hypothetical protein ABWZ57_05405 [Mesorhizobium sp.]|jgi:hypothetical protein